MDKALRIFAFFLWLMSFAYLAGGVYQVFVWGMNRFAWNWSDLPPFSTMEFRENSVIAIALAGISNITALRLGQLNEGIRKTSGWLVLVFGSYLMISKFLVCLVSADTEIARLHQVTVFASMLMALAGLKALADTGKCQD